MSRNRQLIGELISECLAMMIVITLGDSVAAMFTLYDPSPYAQAYWGVCMAWGVAVTISIYVTGSVSGTHANPAVTLALVLYRKFPARKAPLYMLAQVTGAFLGAALVYQMFSPMIDIFNATHHVGREAGGAAGVFFTHPGTGVTPMHAFWDEVILTGILMLGIFAITDEFNTSAPMANSSALIIGLLVACIGASAGYLEAWPLNPARDFGPRLFCYLMGWGDQALPATDNYWWIPIVSTLVGGTVGGGAYQLLIRPYLPRRAAATDPAA